MKVLSQSQDPQPAAILNNMVQRYANLTSYEDSGVVETVTSGSLARRRTDIFFKTYFTRPKKLRFEWLDYGSFSAPGLSLVWTDGIKAYSSYAYKQDEIETKEDIGLAIAGATGVSLGSAHTVPSLLLNDLLGFSPAELTKVSLKGQELFEGEDCYVVEGYHPDGDLWRLWISKHDSALRKLRTPTTNGDFEEQIHRDVRLNGNIPDSTFHPNVVKGRVLEVIVKEKEVDIQHLLEMIAPRERINQHLNEAISQMKLALPKVPEKVWQEVIAESRFDSNMVQQVFLPIYDRHYTSDEIKQLIQLYESPFGQKMKRNQDLIELEAVNGITSLVTELIERIQEKLRAKGYKVSAV
jgi:outer membrane lipoprotein-sorting protein